MEQIGIDVEGQPRVSLSIGPAGAVVTPGRHEHDIARIGRQQADILDQIVALAFQDEPELVMADMEVAAIGGGRRQSRLRIEIGNRPP